MAPQPPPTATKADWRRWARTLPAVDPSLAERIVGHLGRFLREVDGAVLGYLAFPDEVPIGDLDVPLLCLPRVGDDGAMALHRDDGARERHRLGIEQPPAGLPAVAPASLAAVLVPGRVFDRHGYRLGRGGGHYDRLLPALAPAVPAVGVTTRCRIVDRLPREGHDVPMTHLVTEAGVISTR